MTTTTKTINHWTIIRESNHYSHGVSTPDLTIIDPVGIKKSLAFIGGNFNGTDQQWHTAIERLCTTHSSWEDAGLAAKPVLFPPCFLNRFIV